MAQKQKFNNPALKEEITQWMLDKLKEPGMNKTRVINAAIDELKQRGEKNLPSTAALRTWLPVGQRRGKGAASATRKASAATGKVSISNIRRQMDSIREQALSTLREKADAITKLQSE